MKTLRNSRQKVRSHPVSGTKTTNSLISSISTAINTCSGFPKPDQANPGLVKFFILISGPATCTNLNEEKVGAFGFQHYDAGVLVENPSHIQKQTGSKIARGTLFQPLASAKRDPLLRVSQREVGFVKTNIIVGRQMKCSRPFFVLLVFCLFILLLQLKCMRCDWVTKNRSTQACCSRRARYG